MAISVFKTTGIINMRSEYASTHIRATKIIAQIKLKYVKMFSKRILSTLLELLFLATFTSFLFFLYSSSFSDNPIFISGQTLSSGTISFFLNIKLLYHTNL